MILQRSRRILSKLKGYRVATPDDAERFGVKSGLEPSEQMIGVYTNPEGSKLPQIGVTTVRFCLYFSNGSTEYLKYKDIKGTSLGEDGKSSRTLTITQHDGAAHKVEIAGGEGRFRDTMAFIRFIDRVVSDLQSTGSL